MSIILLCAVVAYVVIALIFNLMFISFYNEEKESCTGNRFADLTALFIGAALWPIATIYGMFKMKQGEK